MPSPLGQEGLGPLEQGSPELPLALNRAQPAGVMQSPTAPGVLVVQESPPVQAQLGIFPWQPSSSCVPHLPTSWGEAHVLGVHGGAQ